jgi:hypothetical protein
VSLVGRCDDQGVAVLLRELEGLLHGLVERDGLADLTARVGCVVALVDRRALDLQEEALGGQPRSVMCENSAAGVAS